MDDRRWQARPVPESDRSWFGSECNSDYLVTLPFQKVCVAILCCTLVTRQQYTDVLDSFRISKPKNTQNNKQYVSPQFVEKRERERCSKRLEN